MIIRRFENKDTKEVSDLIIKTLRTTNIKDYSVEYIEKDVKVLQPKDILDKFHKRVTTLFWLKFYNLKIYSIRLSG